MALTAAPVIAGQQGGGGGGYHGGQPITVVADGLDGPLELADGPGRTLYVTEAVPGQVTRVGIRSGSTKPVVTGVAGASGAARIGGKFAIVTADDTPPPDAPAALASAAEVPGPTPPASLLVARPGGTPRQLADLRAYELKANPDGQVQFVDGVPVDALSNPFFVLDDRYHRHGFALVADGGGNDVLRVDKRGKVSTYFVPPLVTTGACAGAPNNSPETVGCDSVPTGLAYGPRGTLYVSTLSAEVPGEGRVYVLDAKTAKVKKVLSGFNGPTGVAVDRRGNVYVSELLEGIENANPGDPATLDAVGRIVRVDTRGHRTIAQVTQPSGLLYKDGALYASSGTINGLFFGIPDAGKIVEVAPSAFGPES
ncbi:ScyD/ScyE family protein [Nakamurella sp. GG22]